MLAVLLVLALTATCSAQRTPPPVEVAPVDGKVIAETTRSVNRELTAGQKSEVTAFLAFHAKRMVDAEKLPEAVKASRGALLAAYTSGTGGGFRKFYATSAAKDFAPAVLKSNAATVLVSGAMVLSRLQQPEILPALNVMAAHGNPAVRYLAMKAYAAMRDELLTRGATKDTLVAMVKARGPVESSPPVWAKLVTVMDFSNIASADRATQVALFASLQAAVTAQLQGVRNGDPAMVMAYRSAVGVVRNMTKNMQDLKGVYAILAAVMANAGQAYKEKQSEAAEPGDPATRAAEALSGLLLDCEKTLIALTGEGETSVEKALSGSKRLRAVNAKLAVNKWVGTPGEPGILAKFEVVPPTVLPLGGPTTKPAPVPPPPPPPPPAPAPPAV